MELTSVPIGKIKPYDKNPRINEKAVPYVANSIKEFGFKVPIVIDKNNIVICGHTRLLAAKQLGLKEVPCIMADDLTPEQVKAFRLADNKTSEFAAWDDELLDNELGDLFDIDLFDMADFGFELNLDDIEIVDFDELEDNRERNDNVIVSIKIPLVANWKMIEDDIKRVVSEANGSLTVTMK